MASIESGTKMEHEQKPRKVGKKDRLYGGETWTVVAVVPNSEGEDLGLQYGQRIRLEQNGKREVELCPDPACAWEPINGSDAIVLRDGGDETDKPRSFTFAVKIGREEHTFVLTENSTALGRSIMIESTDEHGGQVHLHD